MINIICSSKLFKASPRKAEILAAMQSPLNLELMTQLADYLDKPYQAPEYTAPKSLEPEVEDEPEDDKDTEETIKPSENNSTGGGHAPHHPAGLPEGDSLIDAPTSESDLTDLANSLGEGSSDSGKDDVEEATQVIIGGNVNAATEIESIPSIDVLKGTLNGIGDTAGVERIQVKDKELWIYYNDDKNLNNIMTPVIEYLNGAGYTYLEFNRLARSDNAIVFELSVSTEGVKPLESEEE